MVSRINKFLFTNLQTNGVIPGQINTSQSTCLELSAEAVAVRQILDVQ